MATINITFTNVDTFNFSISLNLYSAVAIIYLITEVNSMAGGTKLLENKLIDI